MQVKQPLFSSLRPGLRAVVFGSSGGLGSAILKLLAASHQVARVYAFSRGGTPEGLDKVEFGTFDLKNEDSLARAAAQCKAGGPVHLVVVATGVLQGNSGLRPEKTWRELEAGAMAESFAINAIGPALIAKQFLGLLPQGEKSVFAVLSARVGSIEDNRLGGWYAYRTAKAALHMLVRTLAIELTRRNPAAVCIALHPGTVDTKLSRPFQSGVPSDRLFTPAHAAQCLLEVIDSLSSSDSGQAFAWDGQRMRF